MPPPFPSLSHDGFDKHVLYEASVQATDVDLDLFERVFQRRNGRKLLRLREDFCGTALMACDWVSRGPGHEAWGVDLDRPTLDWARANRLRHLGPAAERLHLLEANVLDVDTPAVDLIAALNFSYLIFRERALMKRYFQRAYDSLRPDGLLVLDLFGGPYAQQVMKETKEVPAGRDAAGHRYPAFRYIWEQARFNSVNHEIFCHIHFDLRRGPRIFRAFSYHWRLWSLPELKDLLLEAGFHGVDAYFESWDDAKGTTDGRLRLRKRYEGMDAWIAYLVAAKRT